jgi:hypothetical protein
MSNAAHGASPSTARHPWLRRVLIGLAILAGVLLASAVAVAVWIRSEPGRRYVARRVERLLAAEIHGSLRIGAITEISRRGLTATNVRFAAPGGEQVIVVERADLDVRWRDLLRGKFVSSYTRASGGRVVLHDDAQGTLSIDATFQGRPSPGAQAQPSSDGGGSNVDFKRIDVSGIDLVGAIHGVPDFRVSGITCRLALRQYPPNGELLLTIADLHGRGHLDTPVAIDLTFVGGTFRLDTGSRERTRADLVAMLSDNRVRLHHTTTMSGDEPHITVRMTMPSDSGPLDGLSTILQASLAGATSSNFDFTVTRD